MHYYFLLFILLSSCDSKIKVNQEICEELSMKKYRGLPKESVLFNKHCKDYKVKYSQDLCQKALEKMILGQTKKMLQEKYGEKILGCFNQSDLKRFTK